MTLERFSISARPELEVALQGATDQGGAKEDGVSYADPEEDGVYGPYETGCEDGRKCYEISLQQALAGLQVTVRLQGVIPLSGLVGWWRADALEDAGDGDEVAAWPASMGDYPLTSETTVAPRYREDRINGLPSLRTDSDEFEGIGMALETGFHYASSGEGRQLVLVCKIPAYAYGYLNMTGQIYSSSLQFKGWSPARFTGVDVGGDTPGSYSSSEVAERSTDWCIVSIRYALSKSEFSLRSSGEELASELELAGTATLTRSNEDTFYIYLCIEYGDFFEFAEVLAWDRASGGFGNPAGRGLFIRKNTPLIWRKNKEAA